ncbi:MAG: hypothetical protein ACTS4X_00840 [Candidatus Hodgkinia cicadicola]
MINEYNVVLQPKHDETSLSVLITRSLLLDSSIRTKWKHYERNYLDGIISSRMKYQRIAIVRNSTAEAVATVNFISSEHVHISSMNPIAITWRI